MAEEESGQDVGGGDQGGPGGSRRSSDGAEFDRPGDGPAGEHGNSSSDDHHRSIVDSSAADDTTPSHPHSHPQGTAPVSSGSVSVSGAAAQPPAITMSTTSTQQRLPHDGYGSRASATSSPALSSSSNILPPHHSSSNAHHHQRHSSSSSSQPRYPRIPSPPPPPPPRSVGFNNSTPLSLPYTNRQSPIHSTSAPSSYARDPRLDLRLSASFSSPPSPVPQSFPPSPLTNSTELPLPSDPSPSSWAHRLPPTSQDNDPEMLRLETRPAGPPGSVSNAHGSHGGGRGSSDAMHMHMQTHHMPYTANPSSSSSSSHPSVTPFPPPRRSDFSGEGQVAAADPPHPHPRRNHNLGPESNDGAHTQYPFPSAQRNPAPVSDDRASGRFSSTSGPSSNVVDHTRFSTGHHFKGKARAGESDGAYSSRRGDDFEDEFGREGEGQGEQRQRGGQRYIDSTDDEEDMPIEDRRGDVRPQGTHHQHHHHHQGPQPYPSPLPPSFHSQRPTPHHSLSTQSIPTLASDSNADASKAELTTKGRKRKRLAKACSACHKNKRRCDGFAPCSNCEFSSRKCVYLNAAGEPIPAPRTREASIVSSPPLRNAPTIAAAAAQATATLTSEHELRKEKEAAYLEHLQAQRQQAEQAAREREMSRFPDMRVQQLEEDRLREERAARQREEDRERMKGGDTQRQFEKLRERAYPSSRDQHDPDGSHTPSFSTRHSLSLEGATGYTSHATNGGRPLPPPPTSSQTIAYAQSNGGYSSGGQGDSQRSSSNRGGQPGAVDDSRERDVAWALNVVDFVFRDDAILEELIQTFFVKAHPYTMMFHPATFDHRRYMGYTPSTLLYIMCAFSVRFVDIPAVKPPSVRNEPRTTAAQDDTLWLRGEPFAERARQGVEAWLKGRVGGNDPAHAPGTWSELEYVMALCLLSVYENVLGRLKQAHYYLDAAVSILKGKVSVQPNPGSASVEFATLLECRYRTLWMLYIIDVNAAAHGRARSLSDWDMEPVPLPAEEAGWVRHGGHAGDYAADAGSRARAYGQDNRRASSSPPRALGPGGFQPDPTGMVYTLMPGALGEFGHLIRIMSIFSNIMAIANGGGTGFREASVLAASQHEQALKTWAAALPTHLRFDEVNLVAALRKLASPVPFVAATGYCYALMHAYAECSMFYLQTAAATSGESNVSLTAMRQAQAVDNLAVIIDSIEPFRAMPGTVFPMFIVSNWASHAAASATPGMPPSISVQQLEGKLNRYWADLSRLWGMDRARIQRRYARRYEAKKEPLGPPPVGNGNGNGISNGNGSASSARRSQREVTEQPALRIQTASSTPSSSRIGGGSATAGPMSGISDIRGPPSGTPYGGIPSKPAPPAHRLSDLLNEPRVGGVMSVSGTATPQYEGPSTPTLTTSAALPMSGSGAHVHHMSAANSDAQRSPTLPSISALSSNNMDMDVDRGRAYVVTEDEAEGVDLARKRRKISNERMAYGYDRMGSSESERSREREIEADRERRYGSMANTSDVRGATRD